MGVDVYGVMFVGLPYEDVPEEPLQKLYDEFANKEWYETPREWLWDEAPNMPDPPLPLELVTGEGQEEFLGFVVAKTPSYGAVRIDVERLGQVPEAAKAFYKLFGVVPYPYLFAELST